ncbi:MAG: PP2C family protein-serine/threonine phosphatase [Acidobacteriota bacterium]
MDYKQLLAKIQRAIESIETLPDERMTVSHLARTISTNFKELGISGGRLYECRDSGVYELVERFGSSQGVLGIQVPRDYRPMSMTLENGIVVMNVGDAGVDPVLEEQLGVQRFAAIAVGDNEDYIVSFNVAPESSREDLLFSLNLLRYSINQRLRAERYQSVLSEAQRIQQSILPQRTPVYEGFEIYGKSIPAEIVSGDFYDYIPVSDSILGLAIADGTGHGLPAALVVRDIYMGLRMGVDRDFKIVRTMQKLNSIIHRSRMTTKFVSLFYGELELGGTLIYTNAGHNPPFLLKGNRFELLQAGGMVLGPTPDATYRRGYVQVEKGDVLCLYTDGIVEAHDAQETEFGLERLQKLVKTNREASASELTNIIMKRIAQWGREGEDDRTLVIVKGV